MDMIDGTYLQDLINDVQAKYRGNGKGHVAKASDMYIAEYHRLAAKVEGDMKMPLHHLIPINREDYKSVMRIISRDAADKVREAYKL